MGRLLDRLVYFLIIFCLIMGITGGMILRFPSFKFEMSSLDPWILALGILLLIRVRFFRSEPSKAWNDLQRMFQKALEPVFALRLGGWLLGGCFLLLWLGHSLKHLHLSTHGYDMSFVHQPLYWTWSEPFLKCDLCLKGTYLGEHLSFTMALLSPFTNLVRIFWFRDYLIFLLQATLLLAPLWILIRKGPLKQMPHLLGLGILLILSHRGLRNSSLFDLREDLLAYVFLLFALLSLSKKKFFYYFLFLAAALFSKENVAFLTTLLVIPILWDRELQLSPPQRKWTGGITCLVSLAWIFISFRWIIPAINQETQGTHQMLERFGGFGKTPMEILIHLATSPRIWWHLFTGMILNVQGVKYLLLVFLPYAFFLWRSPLWILPAIPGILINLISNAPTQRSLNFHYELVFLPFLIWGALSGFRVWESRSLSRKPALLVVAFLITLGSSGRWPGKFITEYWPSVDQATDSVFLSRLKDEGILAVSLGPMAQVTQMKNLRLHRGNDRTGIPGRSEAEADLLILDLADPADQRQFSELLGGEWKMILRSPSGKFALLRKQSVPGGNP